MMKSMEYTDEEKLDHRPPMFMPKKPDYPCGLCISLTDKELDKLDLDRDDAEVGGIVHGHFIARITAVSSNKRDGEDCCRVELQIESLGIESEDAENEDDEDDD